MLIRIERRILEKLKEQGINVIDILRKYAKKHKEVARRIVEDEKFITTFFDNKIVIVRK